MIEISLLPVLVEASPAAAGAEMLRLFPDSQLYLITEDGNHWRLPPPSL